MNDNKWYNILLALYFFVLAAPLSNAFTSITTSLVVIAVVWTVAKKKEGRLSNLKNAFNLPMAFFSFMILAASFALGDLASVRKALNIIYWMLPFYLVYLLSLNYKNEIYGIYGLNIALFVTASVAVAEFMQKFTRVDGLHGQPNHLASMLDILLPFCIMYSVNLFYKNTNKHLRILAVLNSILGMGALVATGSRGAWLGIIIGFIIILYICFRQQLFLKYTKYMAAIIFAFMIVLCSYNALMPKYGFSRGYDNERIYLLQSSYEMWKDNKILGVGLNNWSKEYKNEYVKPEAKDPNLSMPHNILAFYFSTTGLIGGIGFLFLMGYILYFLISTLPVMSGGQFYILAMLWAYLAINIHGMVDVGLNNKFVARLFFGCLGLVVAQFINSAKHLEKTSQDEE